MKFFLESLAYVVRNFIEESLNVLNPWIVKSLETTIKIFAIVITPTVHSEYDSTQARTRRCFTVKRFLVGVRT